jgi:hypothetical protein
MSNDYLFNNNKRELRILNYFWIGVIIFTSAFTLATAEQLSFIVINFFQILGLVILVPSAYMLIKFNFDNKYLGIVFSIFCLWQLSVVIRGFLIDYEFIKKMLFDSYEGAIIYFAPLILLFPRNLLHVKKSINVILILGVIYTIFSAIFIRDIMIQYNLQVSQDIVEYFSKTLSIPCGFLLLTYIYHTDKKNLLALFVTLLTLYFALYRARRALTLLTLLPIIIGYIVYLNYSKGIILKVLVFILLASILTYLAANWNNTVNYLSDNSTTSRFLSRFSDDTRSLVEEYFYRDMKPIDWIIGKGINGKYYCPGVVNGPGSVSIYRFGIETDYLTIILKGGIISLGLMLLMAVPAMIKGFFHSKNLLSKAAAVWILIYLFNLYPAPVTTFSMNYFLVWISIGICFSSDIRDLSDERIKEVFSG